MQAALESKELAKTQQAIQLQVEDVQAATQMQNIIHQMRMGIIRNIRS